MATPQLQHYTEELEDVFGQIEKELSSGSIKGVPPLLEEARVLISHMELCRHPQMGPSIAQHKQTLATLKKKHEALQLSILKSGGSAPSKAPSAQADEITDNQIRKLNSQQDMLRDALKTARETEEMARTQILPTLAAQTERMNKMNTKVEDINGSLDAAEKQLNEMERRQKIMKILTFGLA